MKTSLNTIEQGLRDLAEQIEGKISWGDTDFSDIITELNQYANDIKLIREATPDLDDLKSINDYQQQAQEIVENQINKIIEDNK